MSAPTSRRWRDAGIRLSLFIGITQVGPALGAEPLPVPAVLAAAEFKEGFDAQVNVNGAVIVGIVLGEGTGIGGVEQPVHAVGASPRRSLCVRIGSIDGLFWSENPYAVDPAAHRWRIANVARRFLQPAASRYNPGEIMVSASLAEGEPEHACLAVNRLHVPVRGQGDADRLRVFVNAAGREVGATLEPPGESMAPTTTARCATLDTEGVRFPAKIADHVCEFDVPPLTAATHMTLKLSFTDPPFGGETWVEQLLLPASERR